jgi:nucleoside-diphosphate-sugar epimerase
MSQRVAITGASGFVGFHLATQLASEGREVVATVRATSDRSHLNDSAITCHEAPLEDAGALARAFTRCEVVFHLAGAVDFRGDWERFRRINVGGTRNVLTAARMSGVRRVVHVSSIVAIGASRRPVSLNESSAWNLGPFRVPYVTTKREAELAALEAGGKNLEVVVANPACVIGPDDFAGSEFGTICRRFWLGYLRVHFGGGNNFVDVRDVAAGIRAAASKGRPGHRYILGGQNLTLDRFYGMLNSVSARRRRWVRLPPDLAPMIASAVSGRVAKWIPGRPILSPEQARLMGLYWYADSSKAKRELGYEPRDIALSVADTYDYWQRRFSAKFPRDNRGTHAA